MQRHRIALQMLRPEVEERREHGNKTTDAYAGRMHLKIDADKNHDQQKHPRAFRGKRVDQKSAQPGSTMAGLRSRP